MGFSWIPQTSKRLDFCEHVSDSPKPCRGFRKIRGKSLSMHCNESIFDVYGITFRETQNKFDALISEMSTIGKTCAKLLVSLVK